MAGSTPPENVLVYSSTKTSFGHAPLMLGGKGPVRWLPDGANPIRSLKALMLLGSVPVMLIEKR
jgi:hypothetical protein